MFKLFRFEISEQGALRLRITGNMHTTGRDKDSVNQKSYTDRRHPISDARKRSNMLFKHLISKAGQDNIVKLRNLLPWTVD